MTTIRTPLMFTSFTSLSRQKFSKSSLGRWSPDALIAGSAGGARCRDAGCDVELLHGRWLRAGCAPVFYGDELCCPVGWRCREVTEAEAGACVFGRLRVPVGARLSPGDNPCVRCWCSTPPLPTCQQAPHGSCGHHRTTTTATTTTPTTTTTSAPTTNASTITPAPAAA
ncbi:Uncharacterized protein GBIM_00018 [Gryllus bimaculatus]|nr:Uncharacterized protein GBIM_00018 [Gryllus bimaculatus]